MSITVPMYGFGGGVSLNFKVVGGTTQPSNPKENTVWVNTDIEITGYYFQPNQPDNMKHGEVWFYTGINNSTSFNALKKNSIAVSPDLAKQMVNGTLVKKDAKIYKSGEWIVFSFYLYQNGNDFTDTTGGWTALKIASSVSGFGTTGICTVNADNFELASYNPGTSISRVTNKMIDLTNVSEIHMNVSGYIGDAAMFLSCGKNKTFDTEVSVAETKSVGVVVLNTAGLTGSFYISVTLSCFKGQTATTATIAEIVCK